jgi:hypothetical protein
MYYITVLGKSRLSTGSYVFLFLTGLISSMGGFRVRKRDVCAGMEADENILFSGEMPSME